MTARRRHPSDLPSWPRWLTTALAAAYVGVGESKFLEEVKAGIWPPKHPKLGRWDRAELDRASDRLSDPSAGARERLLRRARGDADTDPSEIMQMISQWGKPRKER